MDKGKLLMDFLDVTAPRHIEIEIRNDGKVIWVHLNGMTILRACQIGELMITDRRDHELLRLEDKMDYINEQAPLAPHGGCNWSGCKTCFPDHNARHPRPTDASL